ncbi:phytoene desaturase [Bacillus lacus]|uniref:4,4'-diaponeurosporene oxygenase n=1 Tax=Metabacillus lacus TaxID=1983721 RepID=A0A7X2M0Z9_9BACI|nr:phytoene desaturase family protein [Metabacillus lacus]MRX73504.1 phytoene desaturase [Metabacillus lacus]
MKHAAVIGGGLGGLSAAITMASKGAKVTVIEKNNHPGGKLMNVSIGSHSFDFGPNTITMPHIFQRVFETAGKNMENYLDMTKLDSHTRNFFEDGTTFDFSSNPQVMKHQLNNYDSYASGHYDSFLKEISRLYHLSEKHFFPTMFRSMKDYLSPSLSQALLKVRPLETIDHFFQRYFQHPNLISAMNRYATYIGSSPYVTPATFAMIAHLELHQGVYYVKGGNAQIAYAYEKVARELGVEFLYGTKAEKLHISNGKAVSLSCSNGTEISADHYIMNADLLEAFPSLVEEQHRPHFTNKKRNKYQPSISAFVILAGLSTRNQGLLHHNVFFSDNYQREFEELFNKGTYSSSPTIYISNSSHSDRNRSPEGDNLFILVNAPALSPDRKMTVDPQAYKEDIYDILERKGVSIRPHLLAEKIYTPATIAETFGAYRGALYGISANSKLDAFLRPSNFSKDIHNLYFVGGTTHPGGGSPMVTLSGLNVGSEIMK